MNNLLLSKERIKRIERIHQAKIVDTQNEMLISYRYSAFKERHKQAREEISTMDA